MKKILPLAKQIGYKIPYLGDGLRAWDFSKKIAQALIMKTTEVPQAITVRHPEMAIPDKKYLKATFKEADRESKKREYVHANTESGQAPQLLIGDHHKRAKREGTVPMITNG